MTIASQYAPKKSEIISFKIVSTLSVSLKLFESNIFSDDMSAKNVGFKGLSAKL